MQFSEEIAIALPGNVVITGAALEAIFIDRPNRKIVLARLHSALQPLLLWHGAEYDAAGDWTQAQAEAKILELLGENQQEALQNLVIA